MPVVQSPVIRRSSPLAPVCPLVPPSLQGEFAKPHVALKPSTGSPYTVADFTIGSELVVNGRVFVLTDADAATRSLLQHRFGVELGPRAPIPATYLPDAHIHGHVPHRNKVSPDMNDEEDPVHGFYKKAGDTKAQFLAYGSALLRFECEWRETATPFGDRRRFALQYFLADDTIEILDKTSAYSNYGQFTKFIQRQRLPRLPLEKDTDNVVPITADGLTPANRMSATDASRAVKDGLRLPDAGTVLAMAQAARGKYNYSTGVSMRGKFTNPITGRAVFEPSTTKSAKQPGAALPGPVTVGGFPVLSSLSDDPDYICASDLICGGVISVYGRPLLIKTCDPFTAAWSMQMLGIDQRTGFIVDSATTVASERAAAMPSMVPRGVIPLPPHTGALAIGSEEETRVNASKIIPTFRSERNFDRFYQLQGKSLRFESRLDPSLCDPQDCSREFVVSFYLEDDTLAIVEVHRDKKGVSATRWLSRGKHRNYRGEVEEVVGRAVLGNRPAAPLPSSAQDAYDRIYSSPGERFGYADGFGGQGYSGGIYGKQDRVGAGGTGVQSPADLGVRDPMVHAYEPPHRFFKAEDFYVGAVIQLAHAPGQAFIMGRPDGFTKHFLDAKAAQGVTDPRDVFVAESKHPVPALPLEGVAADTAKGGVHTDQLHEDCLVLGKIFAGVLASVQEVVKQSDKASRGFAPVTVVKAAMARYGAVPPVCDEAVIERVTSAFVIGTGAELVAKEREKENARSTKHGHRRPPGGSPDTSELEASAVKEASMLEDPLTGPHLTDFGKTAYASTAMVDYTALFEAIRSSAAAQQILQPRLDKLVSQLRAALLSSRSHLRKVMRDLDVTGLGIITFAEFRKLLMRHHLDIGLSDAQIRALMSRFPAADAVAAAEAGETEPALSWRGFVEAMLDAKTLAPGEIDGFLDFVRGIHDRTAVKGVGGTRMLPENYPHLNKVSAWSPDMDLSRFGIYDRPATASAAATVSAAAPAAPPARPATAPAPAPAPAAAPPAAPAPPAASTRGHASTLSVGIAPEMSTRAAATVRPGGADIRPPPAAGTLDAVAALSSTEAGVGLLQRMRTVFGPKRLDVFRALALYDTARRHVLSVPSFLAALVSAGLKLTSSQVLGLSAALCQAAAAGTGRVPVPQDVFVDYESFLEDLFL